MKSLLISSFYFPPQTGGISQIMEEVAGALGPDRVCCLTGVTGRDGVSGGRGVRVYRRPKAFGQRKAIQAIGWGAAITQIMIRERPRVVQLATAYEGYLGFWLRQWLKLPFYVYAYGNEILSVAQATEWRKPLLALKEADGVLAISQFTANLVQGVGVDPDRIKIVYPGCDADRFRPLLPKMDLRQKLLGSRYRDRVILTVGNLVARKGHDMVIRALPRLCLSVPDVTYLIIGDGPYRAQLETLAVSMGVRDRVIFAGKIPNENLPDLYALSDVFVMASREQLETCDVEGFGLVFLEANACGKPVVGGRSGGIPEAVVDGVTGLLVNPNDAGDIASALARLLTDGDLAARLGQQGRWRVVRDFSWARVADQVQEVVAPNFREQSVRERPVSIRL